MCNERQLNDAIESALESLDITPTMFNEAEGHYKAMASFLSNGGTESDISPYGSIATGTVTRPYTPDEDSYFDFDVLCKRTDLRKMDCKPDEVRTPIEDALMNSDRYHDMTHPCDECLTVEYAFNGKAGGFRLDLSPCIANKGDEPEIANCETYPLYSSNTVSIAKRNPETWLGSNPQGLIDWFKDKNERFAVKSRVAQRLKILNKHGSVYASVEQIPWELERTSLQRAIQFAKRSRDVYYHELDGSAKRPPSCALMILMVKAAEGLPDSSSTLDMLRSFCEMISNMEQEVQSGQSSVIGSPGNWKLENPVYDGSLIDGDWSDWDMGCFFKWSRMLAADLIDLAAGGKKTQAAAQNLLGKRAAGSALLKALPAEVAFAAPSTISSGHKPWKGVEW